MRGLFLSILFCCILCFIPNYGWMEWWKVLQKMMVFRCFFFLCVDLNHCSLTSTTVWCYQNFYWMTLTCCILHTILMVQQRFSGHYHIEQCNWCRLLLHGNRDLHMKYICCRHDQSAQKCKGTKTLSRVTYNLFYPLNVYAL